MRQVVLDTETTGFEVGKVAEGGDRLVEIGLVETWNYMPTGRTWHRYINPERDVPLDSFRIHGITPGYLEYMPLFEHVVEDFLDFIGDSDELVAHNAGFDFKFINFQLEEIGRPPIASHRIIDTVKVARQKFPGAPASLDALCRRFKIDNTNRTLHGALLDAELLALVQMELAGGRQQILDLQMRQTQMIETMDNSHTINRRPRVVEATAEEIERHRAFVMPLKGQIWYQAPAMQ